MEKLAFSILLWYNNCEERKWFPLFEFCMEFFSGKDKNMAVADVVRPLVLPITEAQGLILWDVEFVKEGSEYFLRVYIDREDGGVGIDDCEAVSRALDPILDEADPISQSYHLEVCSAGLFRDLKTTEHIQRFLGREVEIRLYKSVEDLPKKVTARIDAVTEDTLTATVGDRTFSLDRKLISKIKIDLV
jgi:ribosome maturation factor RimP